MSADLIDQQWVYAGHRLGNKDLHDCYYSFDDGKIGQVSHKFKAVRSRKIIGGIYNVKTTPDCSRAQVDTAKYDSFLPDDDKTAEWRLTSDAADAVIRKRKDEQANKHTSLDCLEPMRRAYHKARTYDERVAMEMLVIDYLRRGT